MDHWMATEVRELELTPVARPVVWKRAALVIVWVAAFFGLLELCTDFRFVVSGQNDFLQFYSSGRLSGTDQLYSPEAAKAVQDSVGGIESDARQRNVRLPFHSVLMRPLAALPYPTAHAIFQLLNVGVFLTCLWLSARNYPELPWLVCLSMPLIASLSMGQDSGFVAAMAGFGALLASRKRDFAAGLVLSLCAIKFHLFFLLPLALLLHKRWRILAGGAVGGAGLFALSFVGGGSNWMSNYARAVFDQTASPDPDKMLALHGILSSSGVDGGVITAISVAFAGLCVLAMMRARTLGSAVGIALIGGPMLAVHAYMSDGLPVLMGATLVAADGMPKPARVALAAALLPPVYFGLVTSAPWNPGFHIAITVAMCALAAR